MGRPLCIHGTTNRRPLNKHQTLAGRINGTCRDCADRTRIKHRYDLTPEQHAEFIAKAAGICCVCQARSPQVIDHDHETGKARAYICYPCNTALGAMLDDPVRLRRAADYIEHHKKEIA